MPYFLDLPQCTENNSGIKSHSMSPARKSLCLYLPTQSVEKVSFRKHKNKFCKKKFLFLIMHFVSFSLSSMNFYLYSFVTINFFFIFSLEVIPKKKKKAHKASKLLNVWFLFFLPFFSFPFFFFSPFFLSNTGKTYYESTVTTKLNQTWKGGSRNLSLRIIFNE